MPAALWRRLPMAMCGILHSNEAVTTGLGVAEGIEITLSLTHVGQTAGSVIRRGNMAEFPVLQASAC